MSTNTEAMLAALGEGTQSKEVSAVNPQRRGLASSTEEKALDLLGQGIDPVVVANALGVAPSRISQLLSNQEFAKKVVERRYLSLASHTERDGKYDKLEDKLLDKLESTIPFMVKTQDILRALQTVNSAKRRGQTAPDQLTSTDNIIPLVMPTVVVNKFTAITNNVNQVVKAGDQDLVTIQSGALMDRVKQKRIANDQEPE